MYLNGKYLPLEKASVNVQDRGFIFGDGVYEVIPVISGVPIDTEIHIQRMYSSLSKIDIGKFFLHLGRKVVDKITVKKAIIWQIRSKYFVVGMMMIPLVTSLVDDVLHSVLLMISCADKNLIDLQVIISRHLIIIFNHNRQKKALAVAASDFYLFLPCARFYR